MDHPSLSVGIPETPEPPLPSADVTSEIMRSGLMHRGLSGAMEGAEDVVLDDLEFQVRRTREGVVVIVAQTTQGSEWSEIGPRRWEFAVDRGERRLGNAELTDADLTLLSECEGKLPARTVIGRIAQAIRQWWREASIPWSLSGLLTPELGDEMVAKHERAVEKARKNGTLDVSMFISAARMEMLNRMLAEDYPDLVADENRARDLRFYLFDRLGYLPHAG